MRGVTKLTLFLSVFLLFGSSFVSAELKIDSIPKDSYSWGDYVGVSGRYIPEGEFNGLLKMNLVCEGGESTQMFIKTLEIAFSVNC